VPKAGNELRFEDDQVGFDLDETLAPLGERVAMKDADGELG